MWMMRGKSQHGCAFLRTRTREYISENISRFVGRMVSSIGLPRMRAETTAAALSSDTQNLGAGELTIFRPISSSVI